jgi:hypothetical protein
MEDEGVSPAEASELTHRLQERLLRPIVGEPPIGLKPAAWVEIEAFFRAVVRLQLAMGHPPDAAAAVDYVIRAGIDVPDISPAEARHLARRVPIPPTAIYGAFHFARLIEDPRRG